MAPLFPREPEPPVGAHDGGTPMDAAALRDQVDRVTEEKRRALAEPGPSWREWWFFHASKWYVVLGLLVVDVWVVGSWLEIGQVAAALISLPLLFYGDLLLYRYLYYRPDLEVRRRRPAFHRTWLRPVEFGRWTPEAELLRAGGTVAREGEGPNPEEFL
jgi:hypothetical protein